VTLRSDTESLHRALSDLVRVYQFRDRDRICCHDISVTQCYALESLTRGGPARLNDVAAALFLDKSTASRVVDALESKGYVRRDPDPEDGRALRIQATPAGRRLHARIEEEILEEERRLLAGFEPEVRRAMARLIGELARAAVRRSGLACCEPPASG
jgi:DNA-binding MarR family transcriptional regulator